KIDELQLLRGDVPTTDFAKGDTITCRIVPESGAFRDNVELTAELKIIRLHGLSTVLSSQDFACSQGQGEMRLDFLSHQLLPGEYELSVGLRRNRNSATHYVTRPFTIAGDTLSKGVIDLNMALSVEKPHSFIL